MTMYIYILIFELLIILLMFLPSNLYKFHPLSMGVLLVFYTIFMSVKLGFFKDSYWYSYVMFLVMIGGLMILFMYFTSLANNQMFTFNLDYYLYLFMKLLLLFFMFLYFFNMFDLLNLIMSNLYMEIFDLNKLDSFNMNLMKNLMMDYLMDMNLYMIMYLFFTMICCIFLCKKMEVPLRQMIKI